ncbi:Cleavage polyadenylation factor subunit clp1 [Tulasnella sp. 427]|nr:Cleavage polyadenylation factor subunit clp1 [Tulasnella sp. 427]
MARLHYRDEYRQKAQTGEWTQLTCWVLLYVKGQPSTEYVSDETPMMSYANLHILFEQMRIRAKNHVGDPPTAPEPPRVLIIGPEDSGKTTAAKILVNYSTKVPRMCTPILVNVDPSEGGWTMPGSLSACAISSPIPTQTPANAFGVTATTAPTALSSAALLPMAYWYGHSDPKRNQPLMEKTIQNLATAVKERMSLDEIAYYSGMFIDTPASFTTSARIGAEMRYPFIEKCVEEFEVNTIIVIGHEKLNVDMQRIFGGLSALGRRINVVKVAKSGGASDLDYSYRLRMISHQVRNYFYGPDFKIPAWVDVTKLGGEAQTETTLSPYSAPVKFDDMKIWRIGAETMAPSSALPIGGSRIITELEPIPVDPTTGSLLNAILALLPLPPSQHGAIKVDEDFTIEELLTTDVAGFLLVTSVDLAKGRMSILSPNPGSLSARTALIGSYEWQDQ